MPFISVGMVLCYVVRWWSHLGVLCVDLKKGGERGNCDCEYVLKTTIHKCVCHFLFVVTKREGGIVLSVLQQCNASCSKKTEEGDVSDIVASRIFRCKWK